MTSHRWLVRLIVALAASLGLLNLAATARSGDSQRDDRLTLDQAKRYLLELINRDRSALGRKPVEMDLLAAEVGDRQSEEMVKLAAMSHVDSKGRLPVQRYAEAGGRDRVRENVVLFGVRKQLEELVKPDAHPTFTRSEIEEIEAAYFNEVPPNDGHRQNILRPEHTHVGIGLARGAGDDGAVMGNAEEFVDRYLDSVEPLPKEAVVGASITVGGKVQKGTQLVTIGLARAARPQAVDRSQFQATMHYSVPNTFVKYRADETRDGVKITLRSDGGFTATVPLNDGGKPGLYYVSVWVHDAMRGEVLASLRTVAVRPATVNGAGE